MNPLHLIGGLIAVTVVLAGCNETMPGSPDPGVTTVAPPVATPTGSAAPAVTSQPMTQPAPMMKPETSSLPGPSTASALVRQDPALVPATGMTPSTTPTTDMAITRAVGEAVLADKTLSMNGHNVSITTKDGVVTVGGPVASNAERDQILGLAKQVSGVGSVTSQMVVATPLVNTAP